MSDCVPRIVVENGRPVLRSCSDSEVREETGTSTGPELHGTAVGGGTVDIGGNVAGQLHYSEIGASYTGNRLSLHVDLVGPFLDTSVSGLDGQDPVTIRQAYFRYGLPHFAFWVGALNTHFGYEPNNPAETPFISRSLIYAGAPVSTLELGMSAGNESVQFLLGINGSNYQAYPFVNDYPAAYTGLHLSLGIVKLAFNLGVGPESEASDDLRVLFDFVGSIDPSDAVHIGANYNEGYDQNQEDEAHWRGLALYFTLGNEWVRWFNRGEYYRDELGLTTGTVNHESIGVTSGFDFRFGPGFLAGVEVNQQIGVNESTPNSTTFGIRLGYSGSSRED